MSDIFGTIASEVVQDVSSVKATEDVEMLKPEVEKLPQKVEELPLKAQPV